MTNIITPALLNAGQISATTLADNSVTANKLDTDAVTTTKILNDAVTNAKLENDSITLNSATVALGSSLTLDTDDIAEGSTNLYYTDARAISAVEGEATRTLQEGLTVDADITIGDHDLRSLSYLPLTGLRIVSPDDKVTWAGISLVEYGGDYADADSTPYNIHLPILSGEVHGGSVASPAAVPAFKYLMRIDGNARYGTGTNDSAGTARIEMQTNEAQTSTARGSQITFRVTPRGSTSIKRALQFLADDASVSGSGTDEINFSFDPNTESDITNISTNSTNGFEWQTETLFTAPITLNDVIVLENSATAPATPATGSMYFDTGTNKFKGYNGSAWVDLG